MLSWEIRWLWSDLIELSKIINGFECKGKNQVCCDNKLKQSDKSIKKEAKCDKKCVLPNKCSIIKSRSSCTDPNEVCCKKLKNQKNRKIGNSGTRIGKIPKNSSSVCKGNCKRKERLCLRLSGSCKPSSPPPKTN